MKITNEHLDNILINGNWAIDTDFALSIIQRYVADIKAVERGTPISELGYSRQRQNSLPKIFVKEGSSFKYMAEFGASRANASSKKIPKDSFAVLNLSGAMRAEGDWCNYGMRDFEEMLYAIDENQRIKGTMIIGNSGGGEILAGQILKNAISDVQKPIVVAADYLGSAAVLGTLPAKEIVATGPSSKIGSIGVYATLNKKVIEWYKTNYEDIYATQSEEKNEAWRKYLVDDKSIIQKEVDEEAAIFINEVKKYRPKAFRNENAMKGKMFGAIEAKKAGLIDSIGTMNYAFQRLNFYANHL